MANGNAVNRTQTNGIENGHGLLALARQHLPQVSDLFF